MKMSRKTDHALRAVLDLALHLPEHRVIRASEIALTTGVPPKFLAAILTDLHKAGLVRSKRGPDGGHALARDPTRITVDQIVQSVEAPVAPMPLNADERRRRLDRCLAGLWNEIDRAIHAVTKRVTLDDLRRRAQAPGALDFVI
jgi:Rrf2 family cysteine metabolism transcriptional repressor